MNRKEASHRIEVGVSSRRRNGQSESGDFYKVCQTPTGVVVAVFDGLGHGPEAGVAARTAAEVVASAAHEPIVPLFEQCHRALLSTRGVTMSIARFNFLDGTLSWLTVGNVDGVLVRDDPGDKLPAESVVQRGGVVGSHLPALQPSLLTFNPGDTLILATDGIDAGFKRSIRSGISPQRIADQICAAFAKADDDALVLVAQYHVTPE